MKKCRRRKSLEFIFERIVCSCCCCWWILLQNAVNPRGWLLLHLECSHSIPNACMHAMVEWRLVWSLYPETPYCKGGAGGAWASSANQKNSYRESVKFWMILPESCMNNSTTSSTKSGELSSCNCWSSKNWSSNKPWQSKASKQAGKQRSLMIPRRWW